MRDVFLILSVLGAVVFGFYVMDRLDRFLDGNSSSFKTDGEAKDPSFVLLTQEASDEEIAEEIRRFRKNHPSLNIMLYEGDAPAETTGQNRSRR